MNNSASKKMRELNDLEKRIKELDNFTYKAGKVWRAKINLKKLSSVAYGIFESVSYDMDTEIKNRVLDVLIEYQKELEKEFNELLKGK